MDALEEAFEQLHLQHDTQKAALDELSEDVELRKQGVAAVQEQQRNGQNELAELRKQANGLRGRLASLETLQQAALGQEQGAAVAWLKARGLDSAARVGERLDVDAGWENAVESALGQLIEGVLVDDPASLVDALGELGDGHLALVANDDAELKVAPTSLAARVRGPVAIRRLLARLHAARDLSEAKALQASLPEGDSIITQSGERLGRGWLRVSRSGAAEQARCCANVRSRNCASRSNSCRTARPNWKTSWPVSASSCRRPNSSARTRSALYQAHRAVSELAGQLQGQQGRWRLHARASTASKAS